MGRHKQYQDKTHAADAKRKAEKRAKSQEWIRFLCSQWRRGASKLISHFDWISLPLLFFRIGSRRIGGAWRRPRGKIWKTGGCSRLHKYKSIYFCSLSLLGIGVARVQAGWAHRVSPWLASKPLSLVAMLSPLRGAGTDFSCRKRFLIQRSVPSRLITFCIQAFLFYTFVFLFNFNK